MIRRLLIALVITAGTAASLTASAHAATGSYQVLACNAAPEGANNSWVWSEHDPSATSHYSRYEACPYLSDTGEPANQESGLSTTDTLGLKEGAPPGSYAGWTFTAPAGTMITGITYERFLGHRLDPYNDWAPALRADGTIVPGEFCEANSSNGDSCTVGGPPGNGINPAVVTGLSAEKLSLSIVCDAPEGDECVTGASEHEVWAAMYGATVTLSDSTPPTLGAPSGSLWDEGEAGGYHKGTEGVSVEANDVGGGVKAIVLSADGTPVASYEAACNDTDPQPCPLSTGPQTLTLNTTQLADGTHTLSLVAVDAAGNHSTIASKQITVDNTPPAPPVGLSATATTPGGSTFTASWSDPPGQVAPIASATIQVCPAGGGTCGAPTTAPAAGPATVTVPGPGSWTLAVWLIDAAGNSSQANAAYTTLTVPPPSGSGGGEGASGEGGGITGSGGGGSGGSAGGTGNSGSGSGGTGSGGKGGGPGKSSGHGSGHGKRRLRVKVRLHGRRLIVHVRGPRGRRVRVSYVARRRGHRVAHARKRRRLRHGRKVLTFRLPRRARRHGRIVVMVRLRRGRAVLRTLR